MVFGKNASKNKFKLIFLIAIFTIQLIGLINTNCSFGYEREMDYDINADRIPIYSMRYFVVDENIMYKAGEDYRTKSIDILDVTFVDNFWLLSSYEVNHTGTKDCFIVTYQLFEKKLFVVKQFEYLTDPITMQIALEIIDVSNPSEPEFLSQLLFNNTKESLDPFPSEEHYQMFYSENFLYMASRNDKGNFYNESIRVINCTDINNPFETTNKFFSDNLSGIYKYNNVIYAHSFTSEYEFREFKIRVFNCTDATNLTEIFEMTSANYEYIRFIGDYNGYLYTSDFDNHTIYQINATSYELQKVSTIKVPWKSRSSRIHSDFMMLVSDRTFYIYDISGINSYNMVSNFTSKSPAYCYVFERFIVDGTRVYIDCLSDDENEILYILDISNLAHPQLMYPEENNQIPLPIFSLIAAISFIYIISSIKKKKKKK